MSNVPALMSEIPALRIENVGKLNDPIQGMQPANLENLSDEEAEAMLLKELESLRKRI
jgi:hypothetical protein